MWRNLTDAEDACYRLDDREKQNEIMIWTKMKQRYGYHDRSAGPSSSGFLHIPQRSNAMDTMTEQRYGYHDRSVGPSSSGFLHIPHPDLGGGERKLWRWRCWWVISNSIGKSDVMSDRVFMSSWVKSTNNCFGGMMLIFGLLEALEMEALVDAMDIDSG
ncbi:hypothetical protein Tco_0952570 [Tanacetum coccineum]|uniref:HMG box domain-containing protein n=1 Tax=Tanacetum coccineum TaxID=301880 RepID=A0ABQ5DXR1_9ASTR